MINGYNQMVTKTCTKCKEEKPLSEFHRDSATVDGLRANCKSCAKAYDAKRYTEVRGPELARQARYRRDNPEKERARLAKYHAENREKERARNARYYAENSEEIASRAARYRAENPARMRAFALKREFGITVDQYDAMLVAQGGGCAVCGTEQPGVGKTNFCVDHYHGCCPGRRSCGECVRGLLCARCNSALGLFDDNVEHLTSAMAYLLQGTDVLSQVEVK